MSHERDWSWPDRHFNTLNDAAWEVSMSRFYGGIHYFKAVTEGRNQGKKIGDLVMDKLMAPGEKLTQKK